MFQYNNRQVHVVSIGVFVHCFQLAALWYSIIMVDDMPTKIERFDGHYYVMNG